MRKSIIGIVIFVAVLFSVQSGAQSVKDEVKPATIVQPVQFNEVWGYLMRGEEKEFSGKEPITDIGYFSLWINIKGKLSELPSYPKLKNGKSKVRVHMVVSELTSVALTHFILRPDLPMRDILVKDIVNAGKTFDGVQIDFEEVAPDDRANFLSFLREIREGLPKEKVFSVALPARRAYVNDAYDYSEIAKIADRIIIMAYDEHWSTSKPGPVASLTWCGEIMKYAKTKIPPVKIVMGLPLYGRSWGNRNHSYSLRYFQTMNILNRKKISYRVDPEKGPYFEYTEKVNVKIYFDDTQSLVAKLSLYQTNEISAVSFWRLGQGPVDLWGNLSLGDVTTEKIKTTVSAPGEQSNPPEDKKTVFAEKETASSEVADIAKRKKPIN